MLGEVCQRNGYKKTRLKTELREGRSYNRERKVRFGRRGKRVLELPPTATLWSQWAVWITPGPLSTLAAARCSGSIPEPWPAVGHCLRKSETCEALAPGRETPSTGLPSACLAFPEQEPLLGRGDCPPRRSSPPPSLPTGSSTEFPFYR